ncbi:MAG: nucleotidyl transferase AbiEii/AbiGii toxin family protein [Brevefilum sp.]|nr:nucleotidyl transferase AbiEii/AbiGii toxin family protein [Brevefilum sp.]
MGTSKEQYDSRLVNAANSVLLEIAHLLHAYADGFVVVGGSVPGLILRNQPEPHIGSIDVDIALDQHKIHEIDYRTIKSLLVERGYSPEEQPFTYSRDVVIEGKPSKVKVDFLAGEYGGTGNKHRTQRVQDLQPRKARACDLAFIQTIPVKITGELPNGAIDQVTIQVASIVPFLMMKAQALNGRMKEKDAYDIYYCMRNYPGGHRALVLAFKAFPSNKLVDEGLRILKEKFASPEHVGPVFITDFLAESDPETKMIIQRDAFERVAALLKSLCID